MLDGFEVTGDPRERVTRGEVNAHVAEKLGQAVSNMLAVEVMTEALTMGWMAIISDGRRLWRGVRRRPVAPVVPKAPAAPTSVEAALRRENAIYRQALEHVLRVALDAELGGGSPLSYYLVEELGCVLRKKRPAHAGDET